MIYNEFIFLLEGNSVFRSWDIWIFVFLGNQQISKSGMLKQYQYQFEIWSIINVLLANICKMLRVQFQRQETSSMPFSDLDAIKKCWDLLSK